MQRSNYFIPSLELFHIRLSYTLLHKALQIDQRGLTSIIMSLKFFYVG